MPRSQSTPSAISESGHSEVEALLASLDHPCIEEINALRTIIRGIDPAISESVKWNAPSFATTEHFATFHLRGAKGLQVVLHLGAKPRPGIDLRNEIDDPDGLLKWRGPDRATVTFVDAAEVSTRRNAFTAIVRQWIGFVA